MAPHIAPATKLTDWIFDNHSETLEPMNFKNLYDDCNTFKKTKEITCMRLKYKVRDKWKNPEIRKEHTLIQKVQLLFMLGLPVNDVFENILRNAGTLRLKYPERLILSYRLHDGTYERETTPEKQIGIDQGIVKNQENSGDEHEAGIEHQNEQEDIEMMDDGDFDHVQVDGVQGQAMNEQDMEINQENVQKNSEHVRIGERDEVSLKQHCSTPTTNLHNNIPTVFEFLRNLKASLRIMARPEFHELLVKINMAQRKYINCSTLVPVTQIGIHLPRCVDLVINGKAKNNEEESLSMFSVLTLIYQSILFIDPDDSNGSLEVSKRVGQHTTEDELISIKPIIDVFTILLTALFENICETTPEKQIGIDRNFFEYDQVGDVKDESIEVYLEIDRENGELMQVGARDGFSLTHYSSTQPASLHAHIPTVFVFLQNLNASLLVMSRTEFAELLEGVEMAKQNYKNSSMLVPVTQIGIHLPRCVDLLINGKARNNEESLSMFSVLTLIYQSICFIGSDDLKEHLDATIRVRQLATEDELISIKPIIDAFNILLESVSGIQE